MKHKGWLTCSGLLLRVPSRTPLTVFPLFVDLLALAVKYTSATTHFLLLPQAEPRSTMASDPKDKNGRASRSSSERGGGNSSSKSSTGDAKKKAGEAAAKAGEAAKTASKAVGGAVNGAADALGGVRPVQVCW